MSQLQSVLRRSVAHLDPSDHDGRERVFVNAREAMIRLLWSYDPPLSPREIDSKIDEFDDIVAIILGEDVDEAESAEAEDPEDEAEAEDETDLDAEVAVAVTAPAALPAPPRPPADAPAMSERRAEALAILRRPARFEPLSQIGSPTPGALPGRTEAPAAAAKTPSESALLAKLAVDQALARLNGKLAPIPEEDEVETDDELDALDEPPVEEADEVEASDEIAEDDADLFEEAEAASELDADDDERDEEAAEEDEGREVDPEDEPDEEQDPDEDDGRDTDDELADDEPTDDEPTDDDTDEADLPADPRARAAPKHLVEDEDDAADDREDTDDDDDDDLRERPTLRERLSEIAGGLNGTMIAAAVAGVVALAGIVLGTTYFMGKSDAPQQTAAAPEQPAPPAASAGEPAPPAATPAEPATPPAEAAQPPAAIPNGGLALETLSLFDGRDPSVFQSSPGNPIRFEGDTQGGFARIASSTNGAGSRITVGRGVFERLAGRTVRIVVVARAAATDPASSLRFSYQNGRSLSPWFDGPLGAGYAPLSLTWKVPKERGGPETDAIMIEPGIPGDGTAADVSSVRIEILQ